MKFIILTGLLAFSLSGLSAYAHVAMNTGAAKSAALAAAPQTTAPSCDNETVDSLTEKALYVMAKRYKSEKVGVGVAIQNGTKITTSVAIFQGKGGNDGVKVDRIGSITVDLEKCDIHNTLIGIFDILDVK